MTYYKISLEEINKKREEKNLPILQVLVDQDGQFFLKDGKGRLLYLRIESLPELGGVRF